MIKYSYLFLALLILTLKSLHAQTPAKETLWSEQDPWEGVPEYYQKWNYPNFQFPHSLSAWQNERVRVRDTLLRLLGNIPGRPQQLNVKTVFKKKMNGYMLEKFIIDNGIDSWIPGYLAIP